MHWLKFFEEGKPVLIGDVLARVMPSSGYKEDASGKKHANNSRPDAGHTESSVICTVGGTRRNSGGHGRNFRPSGWKCQLAGT